LLYSATSVVVFGHSLWAHPGRGIVGLSFPDPEIFVWSFAWWAHALSSGIDPFVTKVVYYPVGANLMWTASAPGLALLFTPLTLLIGPTAAFNVAELLVPALAAWTAFLLCRYLTGSNWAAIVGGYLFGFSSYGVAHEYGGHVNLGVFLLPLAALVVLRFLREELSGRALAWRLGTILALQFTISTELAFTLTLALATSLLIAFGTLPAYRRRMVSALTPIAAAYGLAALLAAPFVAYLVTGFETGKTQLYALGGNDLVNLVLPTSLIAVGGSAFQSITRHFVPNLLDSDLYLGLPTLVIFGLFVVRWRRRPESRFLAASFAVALLLALGPALYVDGRRVLSLPWRLVESLPPFDSVAVTRLAAYATLAATVAVALWIGGSTGRLFGRPTVLPLLALASIAPATWRVPFVKTPARPPFFAQSLYRRCMYRGETLAIFPYGRFGDSMLWQAESDFWFKMAEGNLGRDTYPPRFVFADPTVVALQFYWYGPQPRPSMQQLKTYALRRRVDRIVSVEADGYPSGPDMRAFGPVQSTGGVFVAPACGYTSLAGDSRGSPAG
jgi:hypothetical protein